MNIDWLTPYLAILPLLAAVPLLFLPASLAGEGSGKGVFLHPLAHLLPTTPEPQWQRHLHRALFTWLWLCLTVAIAQPVQRGAKLPDLPPERDILLLVDVSISMTLTDTPSTGKNAAAWTYSKPCCMISPTACKANASA